MSTDRTSSAALVRTLGIVATVCGLIIVAAYQGTLEAVHHNKRIALERAVFQVIPLASSMVPYYATPGGLVPAEGETPPEQAVKFYAAYDSAGKLQGIAAEGAARGYADLVRVLYAYDPQRQAIVGFSVVQMKETPGIGDKVITDREFLANFQALDTRLNGEGKGLAHPVKVVKHGTKANPWEIDAIAGATVTSKAVGKGINESAEQILPRLAPQIDNIRSRQ